MMSCILCSPSCAEACMRHLFLGGLQQSVCAHAASGGMQQLDKRQRPGMQRKPYRSVPTVPARAQPQGARVGSDLGFDDSTLQLPGREEAGAEQAQLEDELLPDQALVRSAALSHAGVAASPHSVPSHCLAP